MTQIRLLTPRRLSGIAVRLALLTAAVVYALEVTAPPTPERGVAALPRSVVVGDDPGRSHRLNVGTVVDRGIISSGFGLRRAPFGGARVHHGGIDIAAPPGTRIRAAAGGKVDRIGQESGYGRFIVIRHSGRLVTAYAHLSRFALNLKAGSSVRQGEVIGYVGSTGRATGAHLHFEVRRDGKPVDPLILPRPSRGS